MPSIQEDMIAFRGQLETGAIQRAYRTLIGAMKGLRTHFQDRYPGYIVSGLYRGCLDMSYFAVVPPSFRSRNLKVAIVFNYDAFRFEAWLAGTHRQVQREYWELINDSGWAEYRLVTPVKWVDAIIAGDLVEEPDFDDIDGLAARIEAGVAAFIEDVERFLAEYENA